MICTKRSLHPHIPCGTPMYHLLFSSAPPYARTELPRKPEVELTYSVQLSLFSFLYHIKTFQTKQTKVPTKRSIIDIVFRTTKQIIILKKERKKEKMLHFFSKYPLTTLKNWKNNSNVILSWQDILLEKDLHVLKKWRNCFLLNIDKHSKVNIKQLGKNILPK